MLPALTGLRCFAALNIVFFHFSNPKWFGPFAPIVDNGYTSVSFFLLMSGYILAYNYSDRAAKGQLKSRDFWIARLSRLYPVYFLALLLSLGMSMDEWHARSHAQFAWGVVLTPLLLQGWHPMLAAFWNTPAWTMCTEAFFYLIFPAVVLWKRPRRIWPLVGLLLGLWLLGMVLPGLYMWFYRRRPAPRPLYRWLLDSRTQIHSAASRSIVSLRYCPRGSRRDDSPSGTQKTLVRAARNVRPLHRSLLRRQCRIP